MLGSVFSEVDSQHCSEIISHNVLTLLLGTHGDIITHEGFQSCGIWGECILLHMGSFRLSYIKSEEVSG